MFRSRTYRPRVECLEGRLVPATFTVKNLNDSGIGSLRGAIDAANLTAAADTIVFKKGLEGTIKLSGEIPITERLTVLGPGASKIAVSGNFASRIFNINNGAADLTVKLQGLELRHGKTAGNGGAVRSTENLILNKMVCTLNQAESGGAIHCSGNLILTVAKSTISGNTATLGHGGGIYCDTATITGSTIAGNRTTTAFTVGGGIFCVGAAGITGCTISGNTAAFAGGGINCNTATITGSTIAGNTAGGAGAGIICFGTATIRGSTISGNRASSQGGGILCSTATILGSTIAANAANSAGGGGIVITPGGLTSEIRNSTISGNRAGTDGGGIFSNSAATVNVRNCTIAFNQAGGAGGGMAINGSDPFLESCLLADNAAGSGGTNLASLNVADTFTIDHCLISVFVIGDATLEFTLPDNNLRNVDARLAPLAFNGGKTQTHALKKGSPAINKGSNSTALPFDQRGTPFKRKLGPAVDIGAFERQ